MSLSTSEKSKRDDPSPARRVFDSSGVRRHNGNFRRAGCLGPGLSRGARACVFSLPEESPSMRTPVKQLAAATASVALALLVGCDDARSSDKDVRAKLNEAFGERAKGDDARQAALKLEEEAVAIGTASPEGKAQAREALARSFHDEAARLAGQVTDNQDRKSTRLNSSHL